MQITEIFDITPNILITEFVSEIGFIEPIQVERRIKVMLRELYTIFVCLLRFR